MEDTRFLSVFVWPSSDLSTISKLVDRCGWRWN